MSKLFKRKFRVFRLAGEKHLYRQSPTYLVTFVRHSESTWNAENRFTGWYDAPLSVKGIVEATRAGETIAREGLAFDTVFTSRLHRCMQTVNHIFPCDKENPRFELVQDYRLNERHYGVLTGFNKDQMIKQFGERQVSLWRRSFNTVPPPMNEDHPHYDSIKSKFADIEVPRAESLKTTLKRTLGFWLDWIVPEIKSGRRVMVVSHHNTLRAIVKYLENLSDKQIMNVDIPTGQVFTYTLDSYMKPLRNKRMQFLQSQMVPLKEPRRKELTCKIKQ